MKQTSDKTPGTRQPVVTKGIRIQYFLLFLALLMGTIGVYFSMKKAADPQPETTEAISLMMSDTPRTFLKIRLDQTGSSAIPEKIYVFRSGAVSVWDGAQSGISLSTLAMADGRETQGMLKSGCFTDAELIWRTGPSLEVYQAGVLLFRTGAEAVSVTVDEQVLSGYRLADDENAAVVTAMPGLALDEPQGSDHVLKDPSWHDQFAFLSKHASDPACQGRQDLAEEPAVKDDLEGLKPGLYEAQYSMRIRVSSKLEASQVGSLAPGQQVKIELLERPVAGGPVWGRIAKGKWVCLQDENYRYMEPVQAE